MMEIREIMADTGMEVMSMKEAGIIADPEENGSTFEENALIKVREVAKLARERGYSDAYIVADDSGLEIDCLNKEPGIYSARYLGRDTSYRVKNNDLIRRTNETNDPDRVCRFVCAIAAVFPDGSEHVVRGIIEGVVADKEYGINGFGFDPIFYVPEFGCTTAELSPEAKNACSHRGNALRLLKKEICDYKIGE